MKATGIVRRIDDLGRVVIPKEIRRTLRIRESDPLEIFTDREGEIILKKYSPIGELGNFAKEYAESLAQVAGCMVCICDHDQVIAAAGSGSKEYLGKRIHSELEDVIADRGNDVVTDKGFLKVVEDDRYDYSSQAYSTLTCAGGKRKKQCTCPESVRGIRGQVHFSCTNLYSMAASPISSRSLDLIAYSLSDKST